MIVAQAASVPTSFAALGDVTSLSSDAVAAAMRADRLFRLAGDLSAYPFLGREGRLRARQIQDAAEQAHQDIQLSAAPVAELSSRLVVLEGQYEDLTRKARTNVILASVGMAAVLGGGGYWIWRRKRGGKA